MKTIRDILFFGLEGTISPNIINNEARNSIRIVIWKEKLTMDKLLNVPTKINLQQNLNSEIEKLTDVFNLF